MRFARNGVAIVRARGALTLRSSGAGARGASRSPGHGAARVRVELSADHGRARMTRRTQDDDRDRPLRGRGRGRRERRAPAWPADPDRRRGERGGAGPRRRLRRRAPPPLRPPPAAAPIPPRRRSRRAPLFAPDSVWNAPLATTPRSTRPTPRSSRRCGTPSRRTSPPAGGRGSRTQRDVAAVHRRPPTSRPSACSSTRARGRSGCSRPSRRCRSRPNAQPAVGARRAHDGLAAVDGPPVGVLPGPQAQPTAGTRASAARWRTRRSRPATSTRTPGPGLSQPWWGATATSLPVIAGHDDDRRAEGRRDPARAGDQHPVGQAEDVLVAGAAHRRHQHGPQRDPRGRALPPRPQAQRRRAQPAADDADDGQGRPALRDDRPRPDRPRDLVLRREPERSTGPTRTPAPGGFFGGPDPSAVMQAFPWDRLQLVKMDLRTVK